MSILVVGSIALDTVKTPVEEHSDLLGGSASYAAVAASFFTDTQLVGIVGDDFPKEHVEYFRSREIDLAGLEVVEGKTFRWSGEYHEDWNDRTTRSTDLNVFEHFSPKLPPEFRATPYVLLANIAPSLQSHVLDQMARPKFIIADTMNLWIDIAKGDLHALLKRVDMLILNDSEAKLLTNEKNLIRAGNAIRALGPKFVAIKKGEHGCLLFGEDEFFSVGAYPLEEIYDPTGAGDVFAGGLAGYLANREFANHEVGAVTFSELRKAVVYGSALASFTVEAFSLERLRSLTREDVATRFEQFRELSRY